MRSQVLAPYLQAIRVATLSARAYSIIDHDL